MPQSVTNLYERITDAENLFAAAQIAARGKRWSRQAVVFRGALEEEIFAIQTALQTQTYRVGAYRTFMVYEPKAREISALPFRDRVIQHALVRVIEPLVEQQFVAHSYACRAGKGTHAGADRIEYLMRRARRNWPRVYCLKMDVSRFFPSIDHGDLQRILRRRIRCQRTLWLLDTIIESTPNPGLPIGNLTSQLCANIYLNVLDHFITEQLGSRDYVRYMDDMILLHQDPHVLRAWLAGIEQFLDERLHLALNRKTRIFPITAGVDWLGYRIWTTHRLLRRRSVIGMRRAVKSLARRYVAGTVSAQLVRSVVMSWMGHAQHASAYHATLALRGVWRETVQREKAVMLAP